MTRESKLAIILFMILMLVVTTLVTDYFARKRALEFLNSTQSEARKLVLEMEALETRLKAALTDGYDERISNAENSMTQLQTRLDYLLQASEEENVRTVLAALQRFNDMDARQTRLERQLDVQQNWLFGLLVAVIGGTIAFVVTSSKGTK